MVHLELAGQALVPGAHDIANRGFKVANMLFIVDVNIVDVKSQPLLPLKRIDHLKASLKVGVQVVVNLFSLSVFDPLTAPFIPDTHVDYRVTLREYIQVFQLAT